MCVSNNLAISGEVLRRVIVGCCGVGERPCCEVFHLNLNGECLACGNVLGRLGGDDDGGDHVLRGWNFAHDEINR